MRVLAVTNMYPTPERRFLGTFVEQQVKGLRQIGIDVEVLVLDRAQQGPLVYLTQRGVLRQRLARRDLDLVHVMYGGPLASNSAQSISGLPWVVSFCGDDVLGSIGPWPLWPIRSWVNRRASIRAAEAATAIIVKSRNLERALPPRIARSKIRVIPNGIDLDRFVPMDRARCRHRAGWSSDGFHVLFASNGDPRRKRLELARAAVLELQRTGVNAVFHPMEKIPHAEVPVWLNASDALLVTSIHEGSVNVVKEALGCNVPVVSVDVGDVVERLEGISGCYIAEAVAGDLAAKLRQVAAGRRRVEGRVRMAGLSLEAVARRIAALYAEVLKRKPVSRADWDLCVE